MNKTLAGLAAAGALTTGGTVVVDRQINPYEDKGTHLELPIKSDIPQSERVEIAKDHAAMTLKGWNDEYAITIEPQIPTAAGRFGATERPFTASANRPLLSKKMEYRAGDVTAFIEPKEGTENEFDIDFTLHSKPDTNVFAYKIEGAEEFDFFYQPALTEEEIAEGAERPENVVGSYAVYHKEKANHRIGSTNYATGKAFHIYRPKAIDANGVEEWCELGYEGATLSVTCSEKWLEGAAYPVRVDPTFGYTSIGGTSNDYFFSTDNLLAFQASSTEAGEVTSVSFYSNRNTATPTMNSQARIYNNSGPTLVVGSSGAVNINSTSAQWWTYNFSGTKPAVAVGDYWIVILADSDCCSFSQRARYFYDSTPGTRRERSALTYSTFPDPLGGSNSTGSKVSLYATYTSTASGAPTPPAHTYIRNGSLYIRDGSVYMKQ